MSSCKDLIKCVFLAVNVFVTLDEEPSLGGGLYLEPDTQLYMAEYVSFCGF